MNNVRWYVGLVLVLVIKQVCLCMVRVLELNRHSRFAIENSIGRRCLTSRKQKIKMNSRRYIHRVNESSWSDVDSTTLGPVFGEALFGNVGAFHLRFQLGLKLTVFSEVHSSQLLLKL